MSSKRLQPADSRPSLSEDVHVMFLSADTRMNFQLSLWSHISRPPLPPHRSALSPPHPGFCQPVPLSCFVFPSHSVTPYINLYKLQKGFCSCININFSVESVKNVTMKTSESINHFSVDRPLCMLVFGSADGWTVCWCLGGAVQFLLRVGPFSLCDH